MCCKRNKKKKKKNSRVLRNHKIYEKRELIQKRHREKKKKKKNRKGKSVDHGGHAPIKKKKHNTFQYNSFYIINISLLTYVLHIYIFYFKSGEYLRTFC